jgi:phage gp36-like protein
MTYAGVSDLVERFGEAEIRQLTDRDLTGAIDEVVAMRALQDANAEIDGYLSARYQLPLSHVPVVLVRLCVDLARYNLHDGHAPDHIVRRHQDAVDMLKRISNGQVALGLSLDGQSAETTNGAEMVSGGRVWGRGDSRGFL